MSNETLSPPDALIPPLDGEGVRVAPETLPVDDELELVMTHVENAREGYELVAGDRERLSEFLPFPATYTLEQATENYQKADELIKTGKLCNYFITVRETGEKLGTIGMHLGEETGVMGFWVVQKAEGRGVVSRSARALLGYAKQRGMTSVEAHIVPTNTRSAHTTKRLGGHKTDRQIPTEDGVEEVWEIPLNG